MNLIYKSYRWAIVLLIATPLIIVSTHCTRDQHNKKKISEITSLRKSMARLNIVDQKVIFNGLPAEYKFALWKNHLESHLKSAKTGAHQEFIKSILSELAVEDYVDTLYSTTPKAEYFRKKVEEALELYDNDSTRVAELLFQLGSGQSTSLLAHTGGKPDCLCNVKDDWCVGDDYTCTSGNCKTSLTGCGTFWLENCDGTCQNTGN